MKDAPVADSLERLVLVTLGERAGRADGCDAFPSRDTIAATVMADPKTVQRVLARLAKRGLIAPGDQSAARYIRADRRPVVYDLMIPYAWFPNADRMNAERAQAGLPPLTPEDRPDIAPPPPKNRRSDLGKSRPAARGDSQSPRPKDSQSPRGSGHGGTENPERGDSQSGTGGLADPRTSPVIIPVEPPLPPHPSTAADAGAPTREGGRDAAPKTGIPDALVGTERQAYEALSRIAASEPRLQLGVRELIRLAPLAVPWLEAGTEAQLRQALTAGLPAEIGSPAGLVRRRLLDKLPPQRLARAADALPEWCGCGDHPAARYNPKFRRGPDGGQCEVCHPDAAHVRA
ncbi:helix-turn-helix domain-containing protein [Streptomyces sp. NPDC088124]|uniref:helix-turn-helix domain-containing protein n=1 Tax=Streptomyces sp. NPDC088124 TaxID=3154654 RepID=UPI00342C8843